MGSNHNVDPRDTNTIVHYLLNGEAEAAMKWLKSFFSSIPYDVKLNFEKEFQYIIYSFFSLIGLQVNTELEKQTSEGRIDMVLTIGDYVYVFEFKLGENAAKAMEQIETKSYPLQWETGHRKVIRIGVAFSPAKRGIADYIVQ